MQSQFIATVLRSTVGVVLLGCALAGALPQKSEQKRPDFIGAWAVAGKCNADQFEFAVGGKFSRKQYREKAWVVVFDGSYHVIDQAKRMELEVKAPLGLIIMEGENMGGDLLLVNRLSDRELVGFWGEQSMDFALVATPRQTGVNWVRCK